jgi:DNA polymerase-1
MAKQPTYTTRIVLLDTHAILHRAYHALPDFTSANGQPTGALYGLCAFLLKIIEELNPDQVIATFDLPEPTHRHEAYTAYKGTRQKTDDALVVQLERSKEVLRTLSIPCLEAPGFEADDILGTLAHRLSKDPTTEVIIASGDMDTLQLVQGTQVRVYTLKKGIHDTVLYDTAAVQARYGFGPEQVADYKGLRGDPSDNIPGVRGIGEKTATSLIVTFGSLDALYDTLHSKPDELARAGVKPRIVDLLREGEDEARFSRALATIRRDAPVETPEFSAPWRAQVDQSKALHLFSELGFRTLTTRLRTMLGVAEDELQSKPPAAPDTQALKETALALWILESDTTNPTLEDILGYANTDSFEAARTHILGKLHAEGLESILTTIELPLTPVIARMEERGILLDVQYLSSLSKRYHADLAEIAARVFTAAGGEFNLNSPRQLGEVLFDKLGIGAGKGKRTATGQRSTREEELRKYAPEHPIIGDILEYRELQKLLSTYIDNLPTMVDANERLHARFSQAGTTTGRISSQSPNMQNIPIKSLRGAAIRRAIIAPKGYTLVAADYSQIELRVAAFLSGDEKLIEVFKEGQDIHTAVAAQVFDVPPELVDKEMRRRAKAINFGILYGMGANALAEATGTSRAEAHTYLEEYFKRFSGIARYMNVIKSEVRSRGYTETWFGRRRHFEGIHSPLPHLQAQAERMALNAPIQGTQADIIKLAMVHIETVLKQQHLDHDAFLILQVHDELVYEVRTEVLTQVSNLVRDAMEHVLPLADTKGVPLKVDVEHGPTWGDMEEITPTR